MGLRDASRVIHELERSVPAASWTSYARDLREGDLIDEAVATHPAGDPAPGSLLFVARSVRRVDRAREQHHANPFEFESFRAGSIEDVIYVPLGGDRGAAPAVFDLEKAKVMASIGVVIDVAPEDPVAQRRAVLHDSASREHTGQGFDGARVLGS